jgi:hypothetical protein
MKFFTKSFLSLGMLGVAFAGLTTNAQTSISTVPKEYYPNYTIEADWDKIQEHFVQIEAAQKV